MICHSSVALDRLYNQFVCSSHVRVERSTRRNFPPIFTKLASKAESQVPVNSGRNPEYLFPKPEVELLHCFCLWLHI